MNKWKNVIKVKHTFVENPTNDDIARSCNVLISQLKYVKPTYEIELELMDIIENFEIIRNCCIGKDSIYKYFTEEFMISELEWFNETLDWLYNIGDEDKFIWIE